MMRDPGRAGRWTLVLAATATLVLAWSGTEAATKPRAGSRAFRPTRSPR